MAASFGIGRLFWVTHEAIIGADLVDQRICLWNPSAERMLGYTAAEAIGMPLATVVPPELADAHHAGIARYASGAAPVLVGGEPVEVPALHKNGTVRHVALSLTAVDTREDERRHVVAVVRDVTAQRLAEERLRLQNDALRIFVAHASHDLRTPLTVAMGFGRVLQADPAAALRPEGKAAIDAIVRAGEQASRMVDDLLTLARIHADAVETVASSVPLERVLAEASADTGVDVSGVVTEPVYADPDHVRRILVNLLSNAKRYGRPPIQVTASGVHVVDDEGTPHRFVEVRVRDHGDGVPEQARAALFVDFARIGAHSGGQRNGLGLSIVRGLAEANGGSVSYEDAEPGACFSVRLRAEPVDQ